MPRDPAVLTRELLDNAADAIEPLVVFRDRATYRVTSDGEQFVVKTDEDHKTIAHEIAGHRRAFAAALPVPEIVAVADDAFAMRWVRGVQLDEHSTARAWEETGTLLRAAHELGRGGPFGAGFGGYEPELGSWREFFEAAIDLVLRMCERALDFPRDQAARIRAAVVAAAPLLDTPDVAWCHGDFQTEHVLIDPRTDRVAGIIDWADHGNGDRAWDVAVVTIDIAEHTESFLAGYGADDPIRAHLDQVVPLFTVLRLLGGAHWLATHGYAADERLRRAVAWRP